MNDDIHQRMINWFVKMGADSSISLSDIEDECKMLCPPMMRDIWTHIIYHVRPVNEVKHIEKVLLLHSLEKNAHYTQKKLKVRVSTINELEILQRNDALSSKLTQCTKEISKRKVDIQKILTSLSERSVTLEDLTKKQKNDYRMKTVLDLKKETEYKKLSKLITFADQLKVSISSLRKDTSLKHDAIDDMYINSCLKKFDDYIRNRCALSGVIFNDVFGKSWTDLLSITPSMNCKLMKKLQLSSLNISKLTDSGDMWNLVRNARRMRAKYEKCLQEKILNSKKDLLHCYLDNIKLEKENIQTDVIKLKKQKNELFTLLLEKSKLTHSSAEVINKTDFDAWFLSEIKCITLEKKKRAIMEYKSLNSDVSKTENTNLNRYKKTIDDLNQEIFDLKVRISSCTKEWANPNMRRRLQQLRQDLISCTNVLRNLNSFKEPPMTNTILNEFELVESIPFDALTSDPDKESFCKFTCNEISEIINICTWLWIIKHQNFFSMKNIQPSFNSDDIRNRLNEVSGEEVALMNETRNFLTELQHKVHNNEIQLKECEHLFKVWKCLPRYGDYIPDNVLLENENFSIWRTRFKEKIQNMNKSTD